MDPVRKLIWYGGYLEGWALYVEFISYDYAADLLEQCGQSDAAQAALLKNIPGAFSCACILCWTF